MEIEEEYIVGIIQDAKFYGEHLSDILSRNEKTTVREFIYDYLNDDDEEETEESAKTAEAKTEKTIEEMTIIPEEGTSVGVFKDGKMHGIPIGGNRAEKYNDMLLSEFVKMMMEKRTVE